MVKEKSKSLAIPIQMSKLELELYIKNYIPNGWKESIRTVDFFPLISDEDYASIVRGVIPDKKEYLKWYVKEAILSWLKK